jgi:hypothetical protein
MRFLERLSHHNIFHLSHCRYQHLRRSWTGKGPVECNFLGKFSVRLLFLR